MPPPLYILLHIYKTAGQTLEANIRLNLDRTRAIPMYVGPMGLDIHKAIGSPANPGWITDRVTAYARERVSEQANVVYGHMAFYGLHKCLGHSVQPRYGVFLRQPVERIISLYYYLRNKSVNHWHEELTQAGWDLSEWLEHSQALWQHNGQVRQLLIGSDESVLHQRDLTTAHLEAAKRHLQNFWHIGLTERFEADAQYLYGVLKFRKFHAEKQVNVTPQKPSVSDELRQHISRYCALDLELYAYAKRLRLARMATQPLRYIGPRLLARTRQHFYRRRQSKETTSLAQASEIKKDTRS